MKVKGKESQKEISKVEKSFPSLTLPPTKHAIGRNGVWTGKLVEEVVPPQSVAGEESSLAWTG